MQNINVVAISGNLTQDPELRHLGSGTAVCELRVAVNGRRKDQSGKWVDKPNFFNVTVWGGHGEACAEHLSKGQALMVEGRLDWREWEAKDGSGKRQAVQIIADGVQFGPKPQGGASPSSGSEKSAANNGQLETAAAAEGAEGPEAPVAEPAEDDIPF